VLFRSPVGEGRERSYLRSDLARLKARRRATIGAAPVSGALHWGEPVLESSITEITERGPVYRGKPAVALAESGVPFESVAELLWTARLPDAAPRWRCADLGVAPSRLSALVPEGSSPLSAMSLLVIAVGAADRGRFETAPASVLARVRPLVRRMAATLAIGDGAGRVGAALRAPSIAAAIAVAALGTTSPNVVAAIDQALVLVADHELNVSAFAARVTASAGADVYGSLSAALAALAGPKHGGFVERVEALIDEIGDADRAAQVVHERARRGEQVPGFGHPLYHPRGDPRADPLLDSARRLASRKPRVRTVFALVDAMRDEGRPPPTIDLGLVALGAALGLPRGFGIALFAVGRTAGWIAHVLEQYEADFLIRPRALYRPRPAD